MSGLRNLMSGNTRSGLSTLLGGGVFPIDPGGDPVRITQALQSKPRSSAGNKASVSSVGNLQNQFWNTSPSGQTQTQANKAVSSLGNAWNTFLNNVNLSGPATQAMVNPTNPKAALPQTTNNKTPLAAQYGMSPAQPYALLNPKAYQPNAGNGQGLASQYGAFGGQMSYVPNAYNRFYAPGQMYSPAGPNPLNTPFNIYDPYDPRRPQPGSQEWYEMQMLASQAQHEMLSGWSDYYGNPSYQGRGQGNGQGNGGNGNDYPTYSRGGYSPSPASGRSSHWVSGLASWRI